MIYYVIAILQFILYLLKMVNNYLSILCINYGSKNIFLVEGSYFKVESIEP